MKTIILSALVLLFIAFTSCEIDDVKPTITIEIGQVGDSLLKGNTQKILDEKSIPGIAGMSMKSGEILEKIELGIQSAESEKLIAQSSKWHLGSITKSMTATLTGVLVDKGYLSWETRIGDLTMEGYLEEYEDVKIYQLLSMTAGIIEEDYPVDPSDNRHVSVIRQEWAIAALNQPKGNSGVFKYSNSSYVVAGVMLELIMETSWEELMTAYVFEPLQMTETGFGAPGNDGELDQPWGHRGSGNNWEAKDPESIYSDNPKALGPAGIVHTSLSDLAKYTNLHLGKTDLIRQETLDVLHAEVNNSGYALGWFVNENGIFHSGSKSNWFAKLFINLEQEFANFSVTNSYDTDQKISVPAVHSMMGVLGQRFENSLK